MKFILQHKLGGYWIAVILPDYVKNAQFRYSHPEHHNTVRLNGNFL